ncbi:hypothetical protein R1sor_004832 [Riccia sorocarpa]|uniref:Uncharacterized protein n=1 Tax=Riccia sorocarpa TaxID=122646 RepID=A0ABD3HM45_9MARC
MQDLHHCDDVLTAIPTTVSPKFLQPSGAVGREGQSIDEKYEDGERAQSGLFTEYVYRFFASKDLGIVLSENFANSIGSV